MTPRTLVGLAVLVVFFGAAVGLSAASERVTLKIEGLTPAGCSSPAAVRGTIRSFAGIRAADVSLEWGEVTVEYETGQVDLEKLITTVERMCLVKITRPSSR